MSVQCQDNWHANAEESAEETTSPCLKLFKCIGVKDISALDIDIAHCVPPRKPLNRPNPIVCRFVRRLARNKVLACRKSSKNVTATQLGFDPSICTEDLAIFEDLSPQQQNLFFKAKKIKDTANFKFCWVKEGTILQYLGVLIDDHLSWKYHIDHIAAKISKTVGIIARLRHFVPF